MELHNWLIKLSELYRKNKIIIKSISSYFVTSTDIDLKPIWLEFFREYNFSIAIFPPILQMKLGKGGLTLDKNVLKSVKDYSNEFIEFFIDNKNGG